MLSVVMLNVYMLRVLSIVILSVIRVSVVRLSVVAPNLSADFFIVFTFSQPTVKSYKKLFFVIFIFDYITR
jgi:hypothetical protein